jgi:hypothetical protein
VTTWADPSATWADSTVTWTGQGGAPPTLDIEARLLEDGYARLLEDGSYRLLESAGPEAPVAGRRTNFLVGGWYFDQQEPFCEVVAFAEGRTDPFYV